MKDSNEKTLKQAIEELIDAYRLQNGLTESKAIHAWEEIAGEFIAKRTEALYIRKNTLFVKINSAALKSELFYSKTNLMDAMNDAVGKKVIEDIVFL